MLLWACFQISSPPHFPSLRLLHSCLPASASRAALASRPNPHMPAGGAWARFLALTSVCSPVKWGFRVQGWEGLGTEPGMRKG